MKPLCLMLLALPLMAKEKPCLLVPDRAETVIATREVKVLGIPWLKITVTRRGEAAGDPKRGPKMIAVPRDPLAEEIEAAKRKK